MPPSPIVSRFEFAKFLPIPSWGELKAAPSALRSVWQGASAGLKKTLLISVAIHTVVVAVHFVPEARFASWDKQALQVVLVNAPSDANPQDVKAQALAQSTLAGGGEADAGMVTSPLPDSGQTQDGAALIAAQRQVQILEREQAALLAALKSDLSLNAPAGTSRTFNPAPGVAQDNTQEAFMRQVAVLDKQVQDYNSRPRRKQLSPATREAVFAAYYAEWSERLEKQGTQHYPALAKGKAGEVVVTVSIRPNGKLDGVEIMRSSGNRDLDRAAMQLIQQLAPYQAFFGEMKNRVDVLDITTRLIFTPGQALRSEVLAGGQ